MAVACRQCETPVDENATICPTCGAPNPAQRVGPAAGGGARYAAAPGGGAGGRVVVTGVDIPFGDLVVLIIKVMLASIPAYLIMMVFFLIVLSVLGGVFAAMMPEVFQQPPGFGADSIGVGM